MNEGEVNMNKGEVNMNKGEVNMKKSILITLAACAASLAFGQGTLNPPGAPAPTMKTLDQLDASIGSVSNAVGEIKGDPRTPLSSLSGDADFAYRITQSGSYYLTEDLTVFSTNGIKITASDVNLDLNGFNILRGFFTSGGSGIEIPISGARCTIRNGNIVGFYNGLYCPATSTNYVRGGHAINLNVSSCSGSGLSVGQNWIVQGCTAQDNTRSGIGIQDGCMILNSTASGNGTYGIFLPGYGNTVAGCSIRGNSSSGIYLAASGNTIEKCTIRENGDRGVYLYGFFSQCDGNTIADCTISGNGEEGVTLDGYYGQCDGNTVANCSISGNGIAGVYLNGHGGQCIGNRVDGNHVTGQTGSTTYGIYCVETAKNLIIRNSCEGQTNNFVFNSNDTYGPEVTASGEISSVNPWANFSR